MGSNLNFKNNYIIQDFLNWYLTFLRYITISLKNDMFYLFIFVEKLFTNRKIHINVMLYEFICKVNTIYSSCVFNFNNKLLFIIDNLLLECCYA